MPYLAGRVASGWDQLGVRTPDSESADVENQLKHRPLDYFKLFTPIRRCSARSPSIAVAFDFFSHDRILFASDSPADPERGPGYIRTTIADLESLDLGEEQFGQIFAGQRPAPAAA